jgi:hypothetical protein
MPHDVVFDHYLSEQERQERTLAAFAWVESKLELFMPLSPMQQVSLKKILSAVKRNDAIAAEIAIAEIIYLEEPSIIGRNKFGFLPEN